VITGLVEGERLTRHAPTLEVLAARGEPQQWRCVGYKPGDPRFQAIGIDEFRRLAVVRAARIRRMRGIDQFTGPMIMVHECFYTSDASKESETARSTRSVKTGCCGGKLHRPRAIEFDPFVAEG
jgi:hypothetical protein